MSDAEDGFLSDVETEPQQKVEGDEELCQLTQEVIGQGLSLLCRTGNGLGHAYVKLDLKDKALVDIDAVSSYIHIRFLDVSSNHLTDLSPLASLTQLLWLKVDNNSVGSFKGQPFAQLTFLQWLSMAVNQLTDLDGLVGPALETLILTGNSIKKVSGLHSGCFANLVVLELRGNQLETTDGINLPNLQKLYLAQNAITRLEGLEKLENLITLHLRENQLNSLDGLSSNMKCLQYLNVRGNSLSDESALQALVCVSTTLRTLVVSENPLVETTEYRVSALMLVPQLERIDKGPIFPVERTEAQLRVKELKEEEITEP
ncbi:leucine-rich repeat-containing protein 23 [Betta splendens]|uniref:Leucine-rich repeat-containing protein 23 n=1 Tax=Betta splendens TaxID=158456 RepID=A0A6P7MVM8_BETSP|nr:leucine-rich repeat-containing protein 23 [Betta splendens]